MFKEYSILIMYTNNIMKIGFLSNKLTLRGTEICLYDYAHFNETILKNESVIITRPYDYVLSCSPRDVHPLAYKKFADRFPAMEYYIHPKDVETIIQKHKLDVLFVEKSGSMEDGLIFHGCKTIVHCVFITKYPHGSLYTCISDFVNKDNSTNFPVLPNIVRVHPTTTDLREELGIPSDAIVFGTMSGADEFNIDYIRQVVSDVGKNPTFANIWFIFLNVDTFGTPSSQIRFLPGTSDMEYKRRFINTCDAMLYGRHRGETFGIACGEFAICGKPIIAKSGEQGNYHEQMMGDMMIPHTCYEECYDIVTNWKLYKPTESKPTGYERFAPEPVMENFKYHLDQLFAAK